MTPPAFRLPAPRWFFPENGLCATPATLDEAHDWWPSPLFVWEPSSGDAPRFIYQRGCV